jgi:spore coat polysaccharide biosynthesis protein SpsF
VSRVVVVVQARMTSTRLPGKILADVGGRPMLAVQLERLRAMRTASEVVVATTRLSTDAPVAALCEQLGVRCVRGDEHDVLSRFVLAARETRADIVVRSTADCPLVDTEVADAVVRTLLQAPAADYASNVHPRTFPRGLDVEAMPVDTLARLDRAATSRPSREHVTWFIHAERPDLFERVNVQAESDYAALRWTVDTPEDLAFVRAVDAALGTATHALPWLQVARWLEAHPEVAALNQAVAQKAH